jgi:hypothetical protein
MIEERIQGIPNKTKIKFAEKLLEKPQKYPLFNSMVNGNLFLDFRVLKFRSLSHDRLDDMKHLVLASYSDIFVSNDGDIHKYCSYINDALEVLNLEDFIRDGIEGHTT